MRSLRASACLWLPGGCWTSAPVPRPSSVFCPEFSPSARQPALPWPLPRACTISSSASHLTRRPDPLTIAVCIEYSKDLQERGKKWFAPGPRPSRYQPSPEPPPVRALSPAHRHSDAHPQSGLGGRPRSPSQESTAHSRSTAHHRGSWSFHSGGQSCSRHTCSRLPGMGC